MLNITYYIINKYGQEKRDWANIEKDTENLKGREER
jgi:hypothetical protein